MLNKLGEVVKFRAMTIQVAVLCDAAMDYNGKLSLLGTFDTIFSQNFPTTHPQCAVALRLIFDKIEEGHHKLRINFVDEDGKLLMPSIDAPVDVAIPGEAIFISRNFLVNIQQLKFERAGTYSIDVAMDGRQEISIPLSVRTMPKPGEAVA